jgi:hypothetical protein
MHNSGAPKQCLLVNGEYDLSLVSKFSDLTKFQSFV